MANFCSVEENQGVMVDCAGSASAEDHVLVYTGGLSEDMGGTFLICSAQKGVS